MKFRYFVTILLVVMSSMRFEMAYTGQPEWSLWGDPRNIIYDSDKHFWLNDNVKYENWALTCSEEVPSEKVPEKKSVNITVSYFWQRDNKLDISLVFFCSSLPKKPSLVFDAMCSIDESEILDLTLRYFRPRESFCPITRALAQNDEANIYGCAGAATDDLVLSLELERRENKRAARWRRQKG